MIDLRKPPLLSALLWTWFFLILLPPPPAGAGGLLESPLRFHRSDDGAESLCVRLARPGMPEVFRLEGVKPRIVIDVPGVDRWEGASRIPLDGEMIRQVRSYLHRDTRTLRMVVDLEPRFDYRAEQAYYEEPGIYCLEIRKAPAGAGPSEAAEPEPPKR